MRDYSTVTGGLSVCLHYVAGVWTKWVYIILHIMYDFWIHHLITKVYKALHNILETGWRDLLPFSNKGQLMLANLPQRCWLGCGPVKFFHTKLRIPFLHGPRFVHTGEPSFFQSAQMCVSIWPYKLSIYPSEQNHCTKWKWNKRWKPWGSRDRVSHL